MYYLGVIDVACIVINSIVSGVLSYQGAVFCDWPKLMYFSGGISTGLWCSACMACMLLAINRLFDLLRPQWMETLFGGNKTYIWLLAPIGYGAYFIWFTPPLIYTSVYNAAFFDPFTATDRADAELYTSWPHTINNFVVIIVLCSAYTCLCVYILIRGRLASSTASAANRHGMSVMQRQIIAQATMICGLILIAATVYVRMQFFE
jgi:putative chemoreceptor